MAVQQTFHRLFSVFESVLRFIGNHPLTVLVLPSAWFMARYLPFWKDADVLVQLVWPISVDNVLVCPPIYCVLGRIPFWVTDTAIYGRAPGIFLSQHPSLVGVYALVICQHVGLWLALRYFLFSVPASAPGRGIAALLLASVASFYSFAHTAGAEAMYAITWFAVFGAGIRLLSRPGSGRAWAVYGLALFLSIGSRHISGLLLGWLPVTAVVLIGLNWLQPSATPIRARGSRAAGLKSDYSTKEAGSWRLTHAPYKGSRGRVPENSLFKVAIIALVISASALTFERLAVAGLCQHFGITARNILGRTLSDRISKFVDSLGPEEKAKLISRVSALTSDPDVRIAIESQVRIGTFYMGTADAIARALADRGLSGQELQVEQDRIILQATTCFYRTLDPRFLTIILKDIWRGFYPTNDQGIALTGPKSVFASVELIEKTPVPWAGLRELPIFQRSVAQATMHKADHDNVIRHWRWIPLLGWCFLFGGIGTMRWLMGKCSTGLFVTGLTIFGIGLLAYAATCIFNYSMPRYALPLLISMFACGTIFVVAEERWKTHRLECKPPQEEQNSIFAP